MADELQSLKSNPKLRQEVASFLSDCDEFADGSVSVYKAEEVVRGLLEFIAMTQHHQPPTTAELAAALRGYVSKHASECSPDVCECSQCEAARAALSKEKP